MAGSVDSSAGSIPVVKLSDFGSARQLPVDRQAGIPDRNRSASVIRYVAGQPKWVGTPQHIAPEMLHAGIARAGLSGLAPPDPLAAAARAQSEREGSIVPINFVYTTSCDIYSLGIALFATLNHGSKPLDGVEDPVAIHDAIFRPSGEPRASWLTNAAEKLEGRRKKVVLHNRWDWGVNCPVDDATSAFVISMMTVEPAERPSAADLLAGPYFDGIRDEARRLFGDERGGGAAAAGGAAGGAAAAH